MQCPSCRISSAAAAAAVLGITLEERTLQQSLTIYSETPCRITKEDKKVNNDLRRMTNCRLHQSVIFKDGDYKSRLKINNL